VVEPARHHELAGPFGRGCPQQRRLHLAEALPVHGVAQGAHHGCPEAQVGLEPRPAKVDVAVAEPDSLVDVDPVVDSERGWIGLGQHLHRAVADLDGAGGQVGVGRPFWSGTHHAGHRHHVLAAGLDGPRHHALDEA